MKNDASHQGVQGQAPQPSQGGSWARSIKVVAWGLLGIRKNSAYQEDLARVQPFHVIVAGLIGVLVFILVLVGVARWAVA